jgi:hypothetical protein
LATIPRYALTDTPNFEVDVTRADSTPITPVAAAATVTDQSKRTTVSGAPTVTISGNVVTVVIPSSMVYAGRFVAECQVQLDVVPTYLTASYEYIVRGPE